VSGAARLVVPITDITSFSGFSVDLDNSSCRACLVCWGEPKAQKGLP
jgi:hypothetical protein